MFPRKAAASAALAGAVFYYGAGWSGRSAVGAAVTLFLCLGGARYIQLLTRVLPRDLRYFFLVKTLLQVFKKHKANRSLLSDIFTEVAQKHPDKTAVVFVDDGRKWSFRKLDEYSNRVAHHFRNIGVRKGDVVAMYVENCPEHIGLSLGLWKIGAVAAFINFNLRQDALVHSINVSKAKALVFSASLSDPLSKVIPKLEPSLPQSLFSVCGVGGVEGGKSLDSELERMSHLPPPPPEEKSFFDVACFIYTSGTTGLPKPCRVAHFKFFMTSSALYIGSKLTSSDVIYNCLPLYHSAGGMLALGYMFRGNTFVLRGRFSARHFFEDCIKYQCTTVQYIGEICRYLLAQPEQDRDAENPVRVAIGNGLRPQIWVAFKERFGINSITEFYGSTEGVASGANFNGKVGAVGHFLPSLPLPQNTHLIKIDPETGDYVRDSKGFLIKADIDEPGEMIGKVDNKNPLTRFDGYEDRAATEKKLLHDVFVSGDTYYSTGDLMKMDEEGFWYFCDRMGDTFRWKGENVSTAEVEGVLQSLFDLSDVTVYGVQIPGMEGRAGMAAIVGDEATLDLPGLYPRLMEALPKYAIPILIRLVDTVALTGTFKLKKVQLRNEGYDLDHVSDPMFLLHPTTKQYVKLTPELVQQLADQDLKL